MKYVLLLLQNTLMDPKVQCRKNRKIIDCLLCTKKGSCPLFKGDIEDFWMLTEYEDFTIIKETIKVVKGETRAIVLIDCPDDTMYIYKVTGNVEETIQLCTHMYEFYLKESVMLKVTDLRGLPIDPPGPIN